jgi:hypothetical protein
MATKILIKKSVTSGSAPVSGDIDAAELAINLADRKIYTKDNGGAIITLDGAYVDSVAPGNPAEGDLWYDTTNNLLKAHNGTAFVSTGEANVTTNLGYTTAAAAGTVTSSDGTDATLPAATTSLAGLMTAADKTALDSALQAEADTLATVTGRGATTATAVSITNATTSTTTGTGALIVTGGVGIVENLNVGGDTIITGDLTVNGTTTSVNSNEVNIGDAIILLNSDETGAASANAGFEIERGTDANVSFIWNESDDKWDLNNEELQNVTLDGGTY